MTIKCIVVSSEPKGENITAHMLKQFHFINITAQLQTGPEVVELLHNHRLPDLIFLDSDLPGLDNPRFASIIALVPLVIVTASKQVFSIPGIGLCVIDYLYKPFSFESIRSILNRVRKLPAFKKKGIELNDEKTFLDLGYKGESVKVFISEIIYLEVKDHYIFIYTQGKKFITYATLKRIKQYLPEDEFLQVHRSYIVSRCHIEKIHEGEIIINKRSLR